MHTEWQAEDMTAVLVDTIRAPSAGGTLAMGEGIRESDGRPVTFAGDWRPMLALAAAIRDTGEPQVAQVPSYCILGVEARSD